jgi:hypothetical protein
MNMAPRTPTEVRTARRITGKRGFIRFGSAKRQNEISMCFRFAFVQSIEVIAK